MTIHVESQILNIHPDLLIADNIVYKPCHLKMHNLIIENESQEYGACEFTINEHSIKFRAAKITPTKTGQFVTIWKRDGSGPIMPFDMADSVEFFIISVRSGQHFGQFIFPKIVLHEKGYVSKDGNGGKRAMRVYAPWDEVDSPIAQKTQEWQLHYFMAISPHKPVDAAKLQKLFS